MEWRVHKIKEKRDDDADLQEFRVVNNSMIQRGAEAVIIHYPPLQLINTGWRRLLSSCCCTSPSPWVLNKMNRPADKQSTQMPLVSLVG
jgi:hypothetical protein